MMQKFLICAGSVKVVSAKLGIGLLLGQNTVLLPTSFSCEPDLAPGPRSDRAR
ncbi:hypothetical protein ACLQ3C_04080 [Gordonia sp. DT30]|uniref:hypothetical protein n=1 Tax=Gordonia sp. DT219 TaxID=3416658 RepID=UPI003CEEE7AE